MSSDEPNTEKLIRARSIGQYGPNRCVDMILDLLDKYQVKATFLRRVMWQSIIRM